MYLLKTLPIMLFLRTFCKLSLYGLGISIITLLICKLAGVSEMRTYSNILTFVGVGVILFGFTGINSAVSSSRDFQSQYARSVNESSLERSRQDYQARQGAYYNFFRLFIVAGVIFLMAHGIWLIEKSMGN